MKSFTSPHRSFKVKGHPLHKDSRVSFSKIEVHESYVRGVIITIKWENRFVEVFSFCICVGSCKNCFYDLMEYITIIVQSNVKKQKCDEIDPLYCEEENIFVKALNMFEESFGTKIILYSRGY